LKDTQPRSLHHEYLARVERLCAGLDPRDYYLWPRTPIGGDHQQKIQERVGVSDYLVENPQSRSSRIIHHIARLLSTGCIDNCFTILDIACGDAIILWQIKNKFPRASCFGLDCNRGRFATHARVIESGVEIFQGFIQELFSTNPETPFDLGLMLNTYRGWQSADLREHERDLPKLADDWLGRNVRYSILTATKDQVDRLKDARFIVNDLGTGEDDSRMICISRERMPTKSWFGAGLSRLWPRRSGSLR
jgi:hypothetical protein